ncbi:MAG: hypothetical protein ACD_61C00060G0003 [uncultured bacterium]|nr:MAG: hypothetical protein ACD_61C00060G0003 [uncultured bacterium]
MTRLGSPLMTLMAWSREESTPFIRDSSSAQDSYEPTLTISG